MERLLAVGEERIVDVVAIAHGGHTIAHSDGRTVFVRHAIPGERVRVVVTEVTSRIVRADALEVLLASRDRVPAPCHLARPNGCGGCDFQHVALPAQRELKALVLRDALLRFGKTGSRFDAVEVTELPGAEHGLHWRTRMRWAAGEDGHLGLRPHRSHRVIAVDSCLLAAPGIDASDLAGSARANGARSSAVVAAARGSDGRIATGDSRVRQEVAGRTWRVRASSFWQVHPALAGVLQDIVRRFGEPQPGQRWWDLYSGAGVLAAAVAEAVGADGRVAAVELSATSVGEARRALHDLPQLALHTADVAEWLRSRRPGDSPHGVVLDPPRTGAGRGVVDSIVSAAPRVVVYVACDPVAFARDVAFFEERGYLLDRVHAVDAFPMTHHLETIGRFIQP